MRKLQCAAAVVPPIRRGWPVRAKRPRRRSRTSRARRGGGWYEYDRRSRGTRRSVSEANARSEPNVIVSDLPSRAPRRPLAIVKVSSSVAGASCAQRRRSSPRRTSRERSFSTARGIRRRLSSAGRRRIRSTRCYSGDESPHENACRWRSDDGGGRLFFMSAGPATPSKIPTSAPDLEREQSAPWGAKLIWMVEDGGQPSLLRFESYSRASVTQTPVRILCVSGRVYRLRG